MASFEGTQYPKAVILFAVFFYDRYSVSYRDLEEIMAECRVAVDHTFLNRWATWYSGAIAEATRRRKGPYNRS
jgi:putative transposase